MHMHALPQPHLVLPQLAGPSHSLSGKDIIGPRPSKDNDHAFQMASPVGCAVKSSETEMIRPLRPPPTSELHGKQTPASRASHGSGGRPNRGFKCTQ